MADTNIDQYLESVYYDSEKPASYSGLDKLYRYVKSEGHNISKGKIRKWLSQQPVYSKHRPVKHSFKRARVVVPTKFYQFDSDTVSMTKYEKHNNGYKYILIAIDILSRYVWTHPLKSLTGREMVKALTVVLNKRVKRLRTDSGSEYCNSQVETYLKSNSITHFRTLNEKKANFAERVIKTLKNKITKFMQFSKSFKWVDALPKITESYNSTYHRSIGMSPSKALQTDNASLWNKQYGIKVKSVRPQPTKPPKTKQ